MDNLAKALSELLEQIECLRDIEFSLDAEPYKAEANWDDAVRRAQDALLQANEVKRLSNPVDDGAVERATKIATDAVRRLLAVYPDASDEDVIGIAVKAALEAAEPHP